MDLAEIKQYLEQNKAEEAVQKFIQELNPVNIDRVKGYLEESEDGKKWLQAITDSKVTKGIETYKEKTLPKLVADEKEKLIAELNPKETEAQKQMRAQKDELDKLKKQLQQKDLLNLATKKATEKNLPLTFIEKFIGEDEDSTIKNIDLLESEYTKAIKAEVESKFKENGRKPKQTSEKDGAYFTVDQIKGMSQDEVNANLDKINKSLEN